MTFQPDRPYNELLRLPPASNLETKAMLKLCIEARVALAQLSLAGELIPNPAILINTIPVLGAQASSEIENIVTTNHKLFQADVTREGNLDPQTKEVLRYKDALWRSVEDIKQRPLSTNLFVTLVQVLKGNQSHIRQTPGTKIATST